VKEDFNLMSVFIVTFIMLGIGLIKKDEQI